MTGALQISDYYELLALHKGIMEAKFHPDPENLDVAGSPLLATVSRRLIEVLIEAERERGRPDKAQEWQSWRQIDRSGRHWRVGIDRASECRDWNNWVDEQRRKFVSDVMSPFLLSERDERDLVEIVNQRVANHEEV